jgi:malate dehydrogenase (oxaloacetate-decarboxylating)
MMRDVMVREGLSHEEATRRFWALGSRGLLVDDNPRLRDFQVPYARAAAEVVGWSADSRGVGLADVVAHVHPTMLIGTSTQTGAFTEALIRDMAAHTRRPIIMPLSNPTSKAEALPADILTWTDGQALVATGSPFAPVELDGITYRIAQANNALVFPGLGLGVTVARASRITDSMIAAAADAVAGLSDATRPGAPLLPAVSDLRTVSAAVAIAVAEAAVAEGLAQLPLDNPIQQIHQAMWRPEYPRVETKPL